MSEESPFTPFGHFPAGGWVHSVAFSSSGNKLSWVGHDSSISVVNGESRAVETLKGDFLPFLSAMWITENTLVAAGKVFIILFITVTLSNLFDLVLTLFNLVKLISLVQNQFNL